MGLIFVEARPFTEDIQAMDAEDELKALQEELLQNPNAGAVLSQTGGFSKIRMPAKAKGKRGGARVIYLYLKEYSIVFFLFVYPKNEAENLSMKQKQYLKKLSHEIRKTIPNSQYAQ